MDLTRLKHCAKILRRHQTDAEQKLWYHLRNRQLLNLKFRRQVLIEPYIVDFACFYPKLVIELDGGQHAVQQQYDDNRTKLLQQHGYTVLRFWNHEGLVQTDAVLARIISVAQQLINIPSP